MSKYLQFIIAVSALVAANPGQPAFAQIPSTLTFGIAYASGPFLAAPAEHILLCSGLNGQYSGKSVTITLEILNPSTGASVAQHQLTLPASATEPPDPCLEYVVPAATTTPSATTPQRPLYIARVALNPQPLPAGVVAFSVQVFSGSATSPSNIRYVPFHPPDPCVTTSSSASCAFSTPLVR